LRCRPPIPAEGCWDARADVDDAGALAELLHRRLGGEQEPQDVDVEHLVELVLGDVRDRREFIDAGIVDQDVEAAVGRDRGVDYALRLGGLRDVAVRGDGLAARLLDDAHDGVGALLARRIVDDDRGAFGRQGLGDRRPDSLRCAGDNGDLTRELGHDEFPRETIGTEPESRDGAGSWSYSSGN
jgi:hypothetical protein